VKAFLFTLVLSALAPRASALAPAITFISPLEGSQAVGVLPLEVTTTATAIDRVEFYVDGTLAGVARKPPFRVMHDFGTSPEPHRISATVSSNGYRTTDSATISTASLSAGDSINVDLVEVPLRARSSRALRADDLRVRENGVEQSVRELGADRGPARFVFVIDRSLSMGDGKLDAALRAVDAAMPELRAGDRAEVVLFNHNIGRPRAVERGESVRQLIGEITPSGGTSLRDALAGIASRERTYALVITDGGDRNSETSEESALRAISGTKTVVEAIILGGRSAFLERAARNTGGTVVHAGPDTIATELRRMIADINSRYTLVYQSHGVGGGWRSIAITPSRRGIEIMNARRGYFAE
jgi:hypothetical protein